MVVTTPCFRQFIHTKNGYDILEGAVVLGRGGDGGGGGQKERERRTRSGQWVLSNMVW